MSKIRVLPDHISNLIAAGEVVERPASVAKELVENAIDAGATRIVIDVESGGRRLLKITDDGEGMTRDDAVLAFERHATSKISKAEDLSAIGTLGFRGEALASIASVARVELVTHAKDAAPGTRVAIEGGRMRDVKDAAHPRGTTIAVRDLFFNTPARRKFLLSEGYRSILPHGVYPVALLFIEVPLEEVDVNVHPAKTEVRFRRAAAVADTVREAVRSALASAGFATTEIRDSAPTAIESEIGEDINESANTGPLVEPSTRLVTQGDTFALKPQPEQERIAFGVATAIEREPFEFVSESRA